MILASELMNLAEAATGFQGGTNVDFYPNMSLDEAMSCFPMVIYESMGEVSSIEQKRNEALVESAVEVMRYGSSVNVESLTEGALDTLKSTITKVFDRIRKFLTSILNKLKVQIDKIRLNGTQLVSRYGDSVKGKSITSDCKVNDYNILENKTGDTVRKNVAEYMNDPYKMRQAMFPGSTAVMAVDSLKGNTPEEITSAMTEKINALKDVTTAERRMKLVNLITGKSLSGDKWRDELRKDLYGSDRVDIAYGSNGFTADNVIAFLKSPVDLDKMRSNFNALKASCDRDEKSLQDGADTYKKSLTNASASASDDQKRLANAKVEAATNWMTAILKVMQDTYGALSELGRVMVKFEQARINLATKMFKKMMDFKSSGSSSSTTTTPAAAKTEDFDAGDDMIFLDYDL